MTCIGNSGDFKENVLKAFENEKVDDMVFSSVLSGNRNFEGRIHPLSKANYLCAPVYVLAYALAGRINIDFEKEALGTSKNGKEVFLRDIFPSNKEVNDCISKFITADLFK
jgi:aconitate hydratase